MFRFLAPVLVFSFLVGCRSKDEAVSLVLSESIVRIASNGRYIGGIDTLNIASGIVAWGRKSVFLNQSKDTIPYMPGSIHSEYIDENYFSFSSGCGTACNFAFIGKMKGEDRGEVYMYPLLIDFSKELIVYQGDGENLAIVKNLLSEKLLRIDEPFDDRYRPKSLAVDSISLINDSLYLAWQYGGGVISKRFKTP
ncbi:MAG: hypothetical protein AAGF87_19020 [Bacteroidota bacterium]